jgi:hypothetical protein
VNDEELRQLLEDYDEGRIGHDEWAGAVWEGGYDPAQIARVYCEMHGWPGTRLASVLALLVAVALFTARFWLF